MKILLTAFAVAFASSAQASEATTGPGLGSRALQQARRVASMENGKDLPSRAFRLGQRAAKNSKIAFEHKAAKPKKTQN